MAKVQCVRCNNEGDAITTTVYGGPFGEEIKKKVCQACWNEWKALSIKIINEYRLDLNDPSADQTLTKEARGFLNMPA
jgi:Fe-S cluster biosynthesis and repair protein YggX